MFESSNDFVKDGFDKDVYKDNPLQGIEALKKANEVYEGIAARVAEQYSAQPTPDPTDKPVSKKEKAKIDVTTKKGFWEFFNKETGRTK